MIPSAAPSEDPSLVLPYCDIEIQSSKTSFLTSLGPSGDQIEESRSFTSSIPSLVPSIDPYEDPSTYPSSFTSVIPSSATSRLPSFDHSEDSNE